MDLVEPYRFQVTRIRSEFSGKLENSMADLNANYKKMLAEIDAAQQQYETVRKSFSGEQLKLLEQLWATKKEDFIQKVKQYFGQQNKYLNTYNSLVNFLLEQGGRYYYDSSSQRITFYQIGAYNYFATTIEDLSKINRAQQNLLKDSASALGSPLAPP